MSKLGDEPAYPFAFACGKCDATGKTRNHEREGLFMCKDCGGLGSLVKGGFTKLERACIDLRIPASGNEELDALIANVQRRDIAMSAVTMYLASDAAMAQLAEAVEGQPDRRAAICQIIAHRGALQADALLGELAKE